MAARKGSVPDRESGWVRSGTLRDNLLLRSGRVQRAVFAPFHHELLRLLPANLLGELHVIRAVAVPQIGRAHV